MGRRKVFLNEFNCFGEEIDYTLECDNIDEFLQLCNIKDLERLLNTQLKHEKYEMAELIKRHIKQKSQK